MVLKSEKQNFNGFKKWKNGSSAHFHTCSPSVFNFPPLPFKFSFFSSPFSLSFLPSCPSRSAKISRCQNVRGHSSPYPLPVTPLMMIILNYSYVNRYAISYMFIGLPPSLLLFSSIYLSIEFMKGNVVEKLKTWKQKRPMCTQLFITQSSKLWISKAQVSNAIDYTFTKMITI